MLNKKELHTIYYCIENFKKQFKVEVNGWIDEQMKNDGYNDYSLIDLNTAYKYIKNTEMKYNKNIIRFLMKYLKRIVIK